MIDIRNDTIFLCGVDGKRLELTNGKHSLYYRCPCYRRENREDDDVCMNRISLKDQESLFNELEQLQKNNCLFYGQGGRAGHLAYEIKDAEKDYLAVYVLNTYKISTT